MEQPATPNPSDAAAADRKRPFLGIDPNLLIAGGVLVASLGALAVYVQQASIMREQTNVLIEQTRLLQEQTKANAWPSLALEISRSYSVHAGETDVGAYSYRTPNRGTGPAIVERAEVSVSGRPVATWGEFYAASEVPDTMQADQSNANLNGRIIQAGEDFEFVSYDDSPALRKYLHDRGGEVAIRICYRSVYGDRWTVERRGFVTDLGESIVTPVDSCAIARADRFRG